MAQRRGTVSSLANIVDSYFMQSDEYGSNYTITEHSHSLLSDIQSPDTPNTASSKKELLWQFRHTNSYWIAISFIFGSVLFTTGSFFWIIETSITSSDYFTLITVAYFFGTWSFQIGSYASYYSIINEVSSKKTHYFLMTGDKTLGYYSSLLFLIGGLVAKFGPIVDIAQIEYMRGDFIWTVYKICSLIGNFAFCIAGFMAMYLNKAWQWKPHNLGWCVSWLNGIGGFLFFIAGIGALLRDEMAQFILLRWGYFLGSLCYLIASIGALIMWKLQMFGYVYMPSLNANNRKNAKWRKKDKIVLYRDIAFINLYVLTAALGITSISYAIQCSKYVDWTKNYALSIVGSIGVLILGSIIHREPSKQPFSYLLWCLRVYMLFLTVNLIVDAYNISGSRCQFYGK